MFRKIRIGFTMALNDTESMITATKAAMTAKVKAEQINVRDGVVSGHYIVDFTHITTKQQVAIEKAVKALYESRKYMNPDVAVNNTMVKAV